MVKVAILGASGMLGSAVAKEFNDFDGTVILTGRREFEFSPSEVFEFREFDALAGNISTLLSDFGQEDFIINCIGIIKPYIKDFDRNQRKIAQIVNGLFPHQLAEFGEKTGTRTIQIATDCVYSGRKGSYLESDDFDALDVYGKSKSLGEVPSDFMQHLRVSIIGPEVGRSTSLLEWVRSQPSDATINGYADHSWNGISTKHFGKIARGIIQGGIFRPGVQHIVPSDIVTKFELVSDIANTFGRSDIKVEKTNSGIAIDRTLMTRDVAYNDQIWKAAGYELPPTVFQMISEIPD